jgi:predicted DCC family thiol-disulfide oxidoreductase YuxK
VSTLSSGTQCSSDPHPTVFYDGACPLCRREIAHYRRIDRSQRLRWVDAATEVARLAAHGIDLERAMAELHVLDGNGGWHRGVDAFLVIWSRLPAYRWLARLVSVRGLRTPLGFAYRHFAAWRYRRRCSNGGCTVVTGPRGSPASSPGKRMR